MLSKHSVVGRQCPGPLAPQRRCVGAPLGRKGCRMQLGAGREPAAGGDEARGGVLKAWQQRLQRCAQWTAAAAASGALLLGAALPAGAGTTTLSFPIAADPAVFQVQKTLVEAWSIVTETYVDGAFNQLDWPQELSEGLHQAADAPSPAEATQQIKAMLAKLGDPFTRWVPPREYADFRVSSDGEVQGVGLLVASDAASGRLVVLAPIKGSPADRAGIQPGDTVLAVDGSPTDGWDGEQAATHLRGANGSAVTVRVARPVRAAPAPGDQVPGVAATRPEGVEVKQFRLRRERLEISPVFATAMHYDDHLYGYVRLVTFSQKAAADMEAAIEQLQRDGAEAFILDLRNNPGGLVQASLEVASLWLNGFERPTIFSIQDRAAAAEAAAAAVAGAPDAATASGGGVQRVVLGAGRAATDQPLVVLVNKNSASASEILAGALHDNHRADVLGEQTYGKGKIQSVFELGDGSALFVTVAKYRTPAGLEIDKVGVHPDKACSPLGAGSPASVPGIPIGPGADELVVAELATDDCVLSAEALLEQRLETYWKSQGRPPVPPSLRQAAGRV